MKHAAESNAYDRLIDPRLPNKSTILAEEWVYRFTDRDGLLRYFLPDGTLRMNCWSEMNDPREAKQWTVGGQWVASGGLTKGNVISQVDAVARRSARLLAATRDREPDCEHTRELLQHRGWANGPMWAHYGGSHAGACMALDLVELHLALAEIRVDGGHRHNFGSIQYRDGSPSLDLDGTLSSTADVSSAIDQYLDRHGSLLPLHFRKSVDWSYEQEARLFSVAMDLPPDQYDTPLILDARRAVRAVILGSEHINPNESARLLRRRLGNELSVLQCGWTAGVPTLQVL